MLNSELQCSVSDCDNHVWAKGLCSKHYQRLRLTGSTELKEKPKGCSKCGKPIKAKGLCHNHYNYSLIGPRPNKSEAAKIRERKKRERLENESCRLGCGRPYHELPADAEKLFSWEKCPGTPPRRRKIKK